MSRRHAHPADGALQALLDGEASLWETLRLRLHLRRCAACRTRWGEARARGAAIAAIIRSAAPEIDTREAWARFVVRSGGEAGHRGTRSRAWAAAPVALGLAALGALVLARHHPTP
ncbi:MAG: zf-HC2 domain-containing protein, partial [Gemmatimonadaceae bacterium]|nr:zf-HC2 domain-containing protein [Gemmatimonadaceae bacterium]